MVPEKVIEEAMREGFIRKCAECGCDPLEVYKVAFFGKNDFSQPGAPPELPGFDVPVIPTALGGAGLAAGLRPQATKNLLKSIFLGSGGPPTDARKIALRAALAGIGLWGGSRAGKWLGGQMQARGKTPPAIRI